MFINNIAVKIQVAVFKKSSLEVGNKIVESEIIQKKKDILATIFLVHYFQE